jgi:RHS repeat-associated protein
VFNGKENDKDLGGNSQLIQDYGFRVYNPAIGRFLSVDPLFKGYPWYTPYQFAGNKPIWAIDLDGAEELSDAEKRPGFYSEGAILTQLGVEYVFTDGQWKIAPPIPPTHTPPTQAPPISKTIKWFGRVGKEKSEAAIQHSKEYMKTMEPFAHALTLSLSVPAIPHLARNLITAEGVDLTSRCSSAFADATGQFLVGTTVRKFDFVEGLRNINITSVGMSFANPSGHWSNVIRNNFTANSLEFAFSGSTTLMSRRTEDGAPSRSLGQVGVATTGAMLLSGLTGKFRSFAKGLYSNSSSMMNSLTSHSHVSTPLLQAALGREKTIFGFARKADSFFNGRRGSFNTDATSSTMSNTFNLTVYGLPK